MIIDLFSERNYHQHSAQTFYKLGTETTICSTECLNEICFIRSVVRICCTTMTNTVEVLDL